MPTKRDLWRTILNGAGIVLSILLAFAIDAWWDARAQRLQEEVMIGGLRQDFATNLDQLERIVSEYHQQDLLLEAYFSMPTPETETEAETEVLRFTLALLWADIFDPTMANMEMMINAGSFDLISDREIQALLWTWKRQFEDTEDDTGQFRLFIKDGRDVLARLGARGVRDDLRPLWREQFERMRSNQELSAVAQTVLADRGIYRQELETLRATTEQLLELLD
jgi:hypothetical protein